jgi:hypothetical protein
MLPAGIRLDDVWPSSPTSQPPVDEPEIAQLRQELRKAMPQVAEMLETMAKLRPIQELMGRLASPQPAEVITHKS